MTYNNNRGNFMVLFIIIIMLFILWTMLKMSAMSDEIIERYYKNNINDLQ